MAEGAKLKQNTNYSETSTKNAFKISQLRRGRHCFFGSALEIKTFGVCAAVKRKNLFLFAKTKRFFLSAILHCLLACKASCIIQLSVEDSRFARFILTIFTFEFMVRCIAGCQYLFPFVNWKWLFSVQMQIATLSYRANFHSIPLSSSSIQFVCLKICQNIQRWTSAQAHMRMAYSGKVFHTWNLNE